MVLKKRELPKNTACYFKQILKATPPSAKPSKEDENGIVDTTGEVRTNT